MPRPGYGTWPSDSGGDRALLLGDMQPMVDTGSDASSSLGARRAKEVDIDRRHVTSTNVRSVGYDPVARVLEVEFHNGRVYQYLGVPESEARALVLAASVGKHLNTVIKPRYTVRRVSV